MLQQIRFAYSLAVLVLLATCTACSKDDGSGDSGSAAIRKLPGTIYWYFAGDAGYYELNSGKASLEMMKMGSGSSRFDAFDISWDNKKVLFSMDVEGTFNFHQSRLVLRDKNQKLDYNSLKDGNNLFDIVYEWDDIKTTYAHISPNEKYIALEAQHFSDMPIVIINSTGKPLASWVQKGESFLNYGVPVWTKDNTLYFRIGNTVYCCKEADGFQSAQAVFSMDGISYVTVNPQGTKLAFRKNKHLWMCNIDGSDMQQITTGYTMDIIDYDGEHRPVFSPDGKHIAFTGATRRGTPWSDHDYPDGSWVGASGGKYGYIIIIPADGKLYDLESKDNGAMWLRKPGSESSAIPCNNMLIWR